MTQKIMKIIECLRHYEDICMTVIFLKITISVDWFEHGLNVINWLIMTSLTCKVMLEMKLDSFCRFYLVFKLWNQNGHIKYHIHICLKSFLKQRVWIMSKAAHTGIQFLLSQKREENDTLQFWHIPLFRLLKKLHISLMLAPLVGFWVYGHFTGRICFIEW